MPHGNIRETSCLASLSYIVIKSLRQLDQNRFSFIINPLDHLPVFHHIPSSRVIESLAPHGSSIVNGNDVEVPLSVVGRLRILHREKVALLAAATAAEPRKKRAVPMKSLKVNRGGAVKQVKGKVGPPPVKKRRSGKRVAVVESSDGESDVQTEPDEDEEEYSE